MCIQYSGVARRWRNTLKKIKEKKKQNLNLHEETLVAINGSKAFDFYLFTYFI